MKKKCRASHLYGELSSKAKFSNTGIVEMRSHIGMSISDIAKLYHVSYRYAWRIIKRKHYYNI
jgi:DNA-binding transcriptional regulator YiaG